MKISQKLENACRVLTQLADRHDGETVTRLDTLAQRENISANFLVQILNELRRTGIVQSKRGKAGGYLLSRTPEEITLLEIVQAIEPNLTTEATSDTGDSGKAVKQVWSEATENFNSHLSSINLASMIAGDEPMYFI